MKENFAQIPAFWQKTVQSGTVSQILGLVNQETKGILGVTSSMKGKDFDYYIAAPSDMVAPEGLYEYTVPACTWAIFTCIGPMPTAIQALQKRIVSEWLPTSGYEYADAPDKAQPDRKFPVRLCFPYPVCHVGSHHIPMNVFHFVKGFFFWPEYRYNKHKEV